MKMYRTIEEGNTLAISDESAKHTRNTDERPKLFLRPSPAAFKMILRLSKVYQIDYSAAVDKICHQLSLAEPSYTKPVMSYTTYSDEESREIVQAVCNSVTAFREERLAHPVQRTKPTTSAEVERLAAAIEAEFKNAAK
jgi:hypothetical protein